MVKMIREPRYEWETLPNEPYDYTVKRLLTICTQDFFNWCIPGAIYTGSLSTEFHTPRLDADAIKEASWIGELFAAHFEIQSGPDPDMERRLLTYFLQAYIMHNVAITSSVIYLRECEPIPQPPLRIVLPNGQTQLEYYYEVIKLWETSYQELLDTGLRGLLPLVSLAKGGATRDAIEEVIQRLQPAHGTISRELLSLTHLLAVLEFKRQNKSEEDKQWLHRRFKRMENILRESPAWHYIEKQGRKDEQEKRVRSLSQKLLTVIQTRYPAVLILAEKQITHVKQPELLEELLMKLALAQTVEEVESYLLALGRKNK